MTQSPRFDRLASSTATIKSWKPTYDLSAARGNTLENAAWVTQVATVANAVMILSGSILTDRYRIAMKAAEMAYRVVGPAFTSHQIQEQTFVASGLFRGMMGEDITYPPDFPGPKTEYDYRPHIY